MRCTPSAAVRSASTEELFTPDDAGDGEEDLAMLEDLAAHIPYIVGMMADVAHEGPDTTLGWCDDQTEFEFGLDILLEGLERRRTKP